MSKSYSKKKSISKRSRSSRSRPVKKSKSKVWKWWKNKKSIKPQRVKWTSLRHDGPAFAPEYKRVPRSVKFFYNEIPDTDRIARMLAIETKLWVKELYCKAMALSKKAEEIAGFYGKMLKEDYTKKSRFNKNFFEDWREVMNPRERKIVNKLHKCNFEDFYHFYKDEAEKRRQKSSKEKERIKKENEALMKRHGYCIVDGRKQKVTNFKLEPPGLFRGRGNHPKMGKLKKRVEAEDIVINIGWKVPVPKPPRGHRWKEVIHDNTVTWLARWSENISGKLKYIMLNPSSKLKGESDILKYERARKLKGRIRQIRKKYMKDMNSRDLKVRQRAVSVYFIDRLALRIGNEKGRDAADTVGCCSLRVEHIRLEPRNLVVHFDFPGKDSIRFKKSVRMEKRVFDNIEELMEGKKKKTLLFDSLKPTSLNKYLNETMEGLTSKVFRTHHASTELEKQLKSLTKKSMSEEEKLLAYNSANRYAAILCNHHRAVPKTFAKSMRNIERKINARTKQIKILEKEMKKSKKAGSDLKKQKKQNRRSVLLKQIEKLQRQAALKQENKAIALSTSKLNYLDPRITVAWCKKWNVPIEKVYNRTQRERFQWAIETADSRFKF